MNPIETYCHLCPTMAPRDTGECYCGLVSVSREPCPRCGGWTRERLEEVLAADRNRQEASD